MRREGPRTASPARHERPRRFTPVDARRSVPLSVEADRWSLEGSVRSKAFAVGALAAVLVAGCGGESDEVSAIEQWAGDVCSAVVDWRATISGSAESLQDGTISRSDLEAAVDETADATVRSQTSSRPGSSDGGARRGGGRAGPAGRSLEQGRDEMRTAVDDAATRAAC